MGKTASPNSAIQEANPYLENPCLFPQASDRILAIKAELMAEPYSICLERPSLLFEFRESKNGKAAKNLHPAEARALMLAHIMRRRRPRIYNHELIIGNMSSKRIGANFYPEGGSLNILEDLLHLENRQIPFKLAPMEKAELLRLGLKSIPVSIGGKALLKPGRFSHFLDFFRAKRYFVTEEAGISHQAGNYSEVVSHGLVKADLYARDRLEADALEDGTRLNADQRAFYKSVRTIILGIRNMASNLAAEAEKKAAAQGVALERRKELLEAAEACLHAPYYPARTFKEGLQACWLVHMAMNLEDFEQGLSFGRLDRILLPLYKADLKKGLLTYEKAVEIMASFQLKTCETIPIYSERIDQYFSGNGVAQGITVGGVNGGGRDCTNELSGLVLDAFSQIKTREPALHVRVHKKTPPWFLEKAAAVAALGCGKPSFFGDKAVIKALENTGMSKPHARDYAVIGCVEMASQGRTYNSSDAALFNLPLCLELALNQGYRFGSRRIPALRFGAPTPPAEELRTFDHVLKAFKTQVRDSVNEMAKVITMMEQAYRVHRTTPVNSVITQGCLECGKDVTWGGAMYDLTSVQVAGLADAGDSLYALKRVVFDEKRMSLKAFVDILKSNWKDQEKLRQEVSQKFPRYGNGDQDADRMTQIAADVYTEAVTAHKNSRGGQYIAGIYSMTCHHGFGKATGALPNGRPAGYRLSNGLSPVDGVDKKGPTAVLQSAASLDSSQWGNCCALNIKFDGNQFKGTKGAKILSGLITAYMNMGGMQIQPNILDAETLREAKEDPGAHPGIVVRVAGYCAYFNDLQPIVQDEVISRTTHIIH
ncbi:pyruvate formate lyase family protein [Desulfatibacillum aliphaticivorans]|uniref:pyruvate formate lyase family protein n=1 Tax=Desulfatibacillum aliphaticivorans TaxID=218208 RepID=UPI000414DC64|nr:pyruvate formate lyase family protein [Desulfatibacillum aliphaticivorans]